jgi:hypothetical protein
LILIELLSIADETADGLLMKPLAILLGCQTTAIKWLVISGMEPPQVTNYSQRPEKFLPVTLSALTLHSGRQTTQQIRHLFGMFLFHGKDGFQHAPGCGILIAQVVDHLAIAVDGDAFCYQIFLDHIRQ